MGSRAWPRRGMGLRDQSRRHPRHRSRGPGAPARFRHRHPQRRRPRHEPDHGRAVDLRERARRSRRQPRARLHHPRQGRRLLRLALVLPRQLRGPALEGRAARLAGKATVPDVLLQSHSASLEMCFYTATGGPAAFPAEYLGDAFAAEHGSWNRSTRTGYKVIRVRMKNGVPTGEYDDFLTGFVVDNAIVWGRPSASPSPTTVRCSSAKTPTAPSGASPTRRIKAHLTCRRASGRPSSAMPMAGCEVT